MCDTFAAAADLLHTMGPYNFLIHIWKWQKKWRLWVANLLDPLQWEEDQNYFTFMKYFPFWLVWNDNDSQNDNIGQLEAKFFLSDFN